MPYYLGQDSTVDYHPTFRMDAPTPRDPASFRDFYESQGEKARASGRGIQCSEKSIVDIVARMATEHAGDFHTLLDVGCGANLMYDQAIALLGKRIVATDLTWSFLALARPAKGITLVQSEAGHLPFRDASFDAAICSETLEHLPDDAAAIRELARVLRPGGWLFLTVPNLWNASRILDMLKRGDPRIHLMPGHLREYSPRQVRKLLARAFSLEWTYPVGFGWAGSRFGGRIERLMETGLLGRFSKSIAVAARRRHVPNEPEPTAGTVAQDRTGGYSPLE